MGGEDDCEISEGEKWVERGLRIAALPLCIAALVLMIKSKEINDYGALKYNHIAAFKYLAYANGIGAGYSVLSAFNSAVPQSRSLSRAWLVFSFDQAFAYLILVAGAVATEVLYLAHKGDEKITWYQMCPYYGRFCNKLGASLILSFVGCVCFVILSLISAHRVFSNYDPPRLYKEDQ
ncbi:hypothetical protein SUGI_0825760 [Cryptomeria japonica]|uniref:CASP-like protein 2A3 n=1 Tax=Cryptomeria japonica TaxID=3369 RepID=UPI0024146BFE|nr:CASP-like protein 2A3 [Cryptomeria japonica]GLJ40228.1 hypothetical protein SUGI_0825760 [Cryptomeria japonica]